MREVFDKPTTPNPSQTPARAPAVDGSLNLASASIGSGIDPFASQNPPAHTEQTVTARWRNPKVWSETGSRLVAGGTR
jgi:hypothetical protein